MHVFFLFLLKYRRNAERRRPLFALNLWNMFHRKFDELPTTNNHVEGWHRRFQVQVSSCRLVFWKFINLLQTEKKHNQGGNYPEPCWTPSTSSEEMIRDIQSHTYMGHIETR